MVLYDGKEAARVDEVLEGSYESTVEYLRALSAEVSRFRDLQKDIKASVGGVHYFEMVAIDCDYVKQQLHDRVEELINTIQLRVSTSNFEQMKSIRDELQEMANKLAIVPEDSEALKGLVEYAKTCEDRVDGILGIMDTEICPKVIFAATNDYELKEEDRILSAEIMDWPKRIASCLQNSYKMQSNEKKKRSHMLERRYEIFTNELASIDSDLRSLEKFHSLLPKALQRAWIE